MTGRTVRSAGVEEALEDIFKWTADNFGLAQAREYVSGLYDKLASLPERRELWRYVRIPDWQQPVPYVRYRSHTIFFRELSAGQIGVIAIFHNKMDMMVRLENLLEKEDPAE